MAASPYAQNTLLSQRYNQSPAANARQPSGSCNYTNLNASGIVPKCGCLRFTDNSLVDYGFGTAPGRPGWCVCEHHSCYHNHDPADSHRSSGLTVIEQPPTPTTRQTSQPPQLKHMQNGLEGEARDEILPDTQWGDVKPGISMESLPAIPSQLFLSSDSGSRASSSQPGYARPFAGQGLNTLSHIPKHHTQSQQLVVAKVPIMAENGKLMYMYEDAHGPGLQSVTELATPSIQSSQDADAEARSIKNVTPVQNALQSVAGKEVTMALRPSEDGPSHHTSVTLRNESHGENLLPEIRSIIADYPMTKRNIEHRLDQLENGSFTHGFMDDTREQQDLLDIQVQAMDARVGELEDNQKQALNQYDRSSIGSRQLLDVSIDSRSSSVMLSSSVDPSRIAALEEQVLSLQAAAPPSRFKPWEVEVVFLPFGPELTGIWSSQRTSQRSRGNSTSGDERTQTQNSLAAEQARLTTYNQGTAWHKRVTDEDGPWLMPRACERGNVVYERLQSRGLVKTINIKGPDSRDVQAAMMLAFDELPDILAYNPFENDDGKPTIPPSLKRYHGLREPWIPLRKEHKVSSLQFLNLGEMLTSTLWTVSFLSSSVIMKGSGGLRRLYVTHPDSYIQHLGTTSSWTWPKLRCLSRIYPNYEASHTPEADAHEPCWEFNERYDPRPTTISTVEDSIFSQGQLSIRSIPRHEGNIDPASPSDHFSSGAASPTPSTPHVSHPVQPILPTPLKERNPFRPMIHIRTTSMPTPVAGRSSPSISSKRPMTSFDREHPSQPSLRLSKRYRTRSPSRPRDTPRWSAGPPSPYAFAEEYAHKRGTTPFAYATPHSNAPYNERSSPFFGHGRPDDDEMGSTTENSEMDGEEQNALSDYDLDDGQMEGDEWEGVQDDDSASESCPSEYPSRQLESDKAEEGKPESFGDENDGGTAQGGFMIHVDDEDDA